MTREETKELLPIMQAFAEGKIIEYRNIHGQWVETDQPIWGGYKLRIKPEFKYRSFKSQEECWNEMLKHHPFGWLKIKDTDEYCDMAKIFDYSGEAKMSVSAGVFTLPQSFEHFVFVDGTPFGIKEG